MKKQAKRQRAAIKTILAAQRKAEEGKPKNLLEAFIASIPDEDSREQYREGVKHGREALYRLRSAGYDLTHDSRQFANIKHVVDQPENKFVNLYYEGSVPGDLPKVPWVLTIKTPPDISSEMRGGTLPCGSWPQFIAALVAFGDKEARDGIRWALEAQGITPIEESELAAMGEQLRDLSKNHPECKAQVDKVPAEHREEWLDGLFGTSVKLRLFPESEPDKVQRIATDCGKSFNEVVQEFKSGNVMELVKEKVEERDNWKLGMPIKKTKTICRDGISMNETVIVLLTYVFDKEGKLIRYPADGHPLTFDEIWTDLLQMDEQVPEGKNTGHDIMLCRLRELEKEMPEKTPQKIREEFRKGLQELFLMFRRGSLSNKQFFGTSADRLEDIKKNGITPDEGYTAVHLSEETPWNAEGCHPWSGSKEASEDADEGEDESEDEDKKIVGLIVEVDLAQLDERRIALLTDGSITYAGTIPWSAVNRYAILDWEEIDEWWEHFVTHSVTGSLRNAVFTRWLMGYPVTVEEMVWPLQHGYKVEDTSPESNRAWCRYLWDHRPDWPVVLGDEEFEDALTDNAIESTVEACPIEDRKWFVEDKTEMLNKRNGITVTVVRDTPWSTLIDMAKQTKGISQSEAA